MRVLALELNTWSSRYDYCPHCYSPFLRMGHNTIQYNSAQLPVVDGIKRAPACETLHKVPSTEGVQLSAQATRRKQERRAGKGFGVPAREECGVPRAPPAGAQRADARSPAPRRLARPPRPTSVLARWARDGLTQDRDRLVGRSRWLSPGLRTENNPVKSGQWAGPTCFGAPPRMPPSVGLGGAGA